MHKYAKKGTLRSCNVEVVRIIHSFISAFVLRRIRAKSNYRSVWQTRRSAIVRILQIDIPDKLCHRCFGRTINYLGLHLPEEPWRDVVLHVDVQRVGVDDWLAGRVLHCQEGLDRLDLHVVAAVGHRLALGGQAQGGHPTRVLTLLEQVGKVN